MGGQGGWGLKNDTETALCPLLQALPPTRTHTHTRPYMNIRTHI